MMSLRQQRKTIISVGVSIVLLIALYLAGWLRPLEYVIGLTAQPGFHLFYALLDTISPLYGTSDSILLAENTDLKDVLAKVIHENHELQTQLTQYQEYAEQFAFAREKDYRIEPAKIISRIGQGDVNQVIFINRGSSQGVVIGYPVIYGAGILLGTITAVHDTYAEVTLLTSPTSQIQAAVQSNGLSTTGIIRGQFGTSLVFEYILKDQPIAVGDTIVTNGQDRSIPSGLVVGTVQTITATASDLFKSADITPLVRYGNNAIVSVIVPKS